MDFAATQSERTGAESSDYGSAYARRYLARLRAALVPFALAAVALVGVEGAAWRRARGRNRAVAVKLAWLGCERRVAELRKALGGIGGLLAWERRATRVAGEIDWKMRMRAVQERRAAERGAASKAKRARWDAEFEAIATGLRRELDDEAANGVEPRQEAGARIGVRAVLPGVPGVAWRVERDCGPVRRSPRRGAARLRVSVWPEELMSARENAAQEERRARRAARLGGAESRRSWVEDERREAAARRSEDVGESPEAMRARWKREADEGVERFRAARAMWDAMQEAVREGKKPP